VFRGNLLIDLVSQYEVSFLNITEFVALKSAPSITEILSHHQAVNAAVHDPYADAAEVSLQNVSAMTG